MTCDSSPPMGILRDDTSTTIRVAPANQAPVLIAPDQVSIREGETIRIQLKGTDADGDDVSILAPTLLPNSTLTSNPSVFTFTPGYTQVGLYRVWFVLSDGKDETYDSVEIRVLNENATPEFRGSGSWVVQEGQLLRIRTFAFDPDNPGFVPQERWADGELSPLDGDLPSVAYTSAKLPPGATYDAELGIFEWIPEADAAGQYAPVFTATDDGDGTGVSAIVSITIPITVLNVNHPPELATVDNVSINRGETLVVDVEATDPEGNPITFTSTGLPGFSIPSFASFVDNRNGTSRFTFAPGFNDRGDYPITVTARDNGDLGGSADIRADEFTFIVSVNALNEPPVLATVGNRVAVVGQPMEILLSVRDLDEDALTFEGIGLPAGATLAPTSTYGAAQLTWTPSVTDLGTHDVILRVTDSGNGNAADILSDQEPIVITVRTANAGPVMPVIDPKSVAETQELVFQLNATDSDGDNLLYTGKFLPLGASVDRATGEFRWTPNLFQSGVYPGIELTASDGHSSVTRTVTVTVANQNQPPVIAPLPLLSGREDALIEFLVNGSDFDGDALTYTSTALPPGATLGPTNGRFSWTPGFEQAGDYAIPVKVTDSTGAFDTFDLLLTIDNINRAPVINVSGHEVAIGGTLAFTLDGSDPDLNSTLVYSAVGLPEGASIDTATGEITWTPGPGQQGDYVVNYRVSDGIDSDDQSAILRASLTPAGPTVRVELTPSFPVEPGKQVLLHPLASSLSEIVELTIKVNGQTLPLDALGRASFVPTSPGKVPVVATAVDADGLTSTAELFVRVRDASDTEPPVVGFGTGTDGLRIKTATDLVGTVNDTNLDFWQLEIRPQSSQQWIELAAGESPIAASTLASIDPGTWSNGFYLLRLTARDIAGRTSKAAAMIEINSATKSGQFTRSESDLSVLLGGETFEFVRGYDSFSSNHPGGSGFGWRWSSREMQIETNAGVTGRESLGVFVPYSVGTRLYMTLPNGQRAGFTFAPTEIKQAGVTYFRPNWIADSGVDFTLQSADAVLTRAGNRFYDLKTSRPYHPSGDRYRANNFTLTAPNATIYGINAAGKAVSQVKPSGTKLILSDSAVIAPNGDRIDIVRGEGGRIASITSTQGQVVYSYDAIGNLVSAVNSATFASVRYGYETTATNRLTLIASSQAGGESIAYGPTVVSQPIGSDLGSAFRYVGVATAGTHVAGQTERYAFTIRDSELASTASHTVLLGIEIRATGGGLTTALPMIDGLTPVASQVSAETAYALFAIDTAGLKLLSVRGTDETTTGDFEIRLFIAGDVNADGVVDGIDGQSQAALLGITSGQAGYNPFADTNRDGTINQTDVQILGSNFLFQTNLPPILTASPMTTHVDLAVVADFSDQVHDPEGDSIALRIGAVSGGVANLDETSQSLVFIPSLGASEQATIELLASDGFGVSSSTVIVSISDATLIALDYIERNPILEVGEAFDLRLVGDFADESNVVLPASYLTFESSAPDVATVTTSGLVTSIGQGATTVVARRGPILAATAVGIGPSVGSTQVLAEATGLLVEPGAVSIPVVDGRRPLKVTILGRGIDLTSGDSNTRYYVSNSDVAIVSPDGLVESLSAGATTVTVINGRVESSMEVIVQSPRPSGSLVDSEGGVIAANDGSLIQIAPGALTEPSVIDFVTVDEASIPAVTPDNFDFLRAFSVQLPEDPLAQPMQMTVDVSGLASPGQTVYFLRFGVLPAEEGGEQVGWFMDEVGVVDGNGVARSNSFPFPGLGAVGGGLLNVMLASLTCTAGQVVGKIRDESPALGSQLAKILQAVVIQNTQNNSFLAAAPFASELSFAIEVCGGQNPAKVVEVPPLGMPVFHPIVIDVKLGETTRVDIPITVNSVVPTAANISSLAIEESSSGRQVVIRGSGFGLDASALTVQFSYPGLDGFKPANDRQAPVLVSPNELRLPVDPLQIYGLASIQVETRTVLPDGSTLKDRNGDALKVVSNVAKFNASKAVEKLSFAALPQENTVVAFSVGEADLRPRFPSAVVKQLARAFLR